MDTPIADHVSQFKFDPFSETLGTKTAPIRGDKTFNDRTYYITNQPAGNNFGFPSTPNAHKIADADGKWGGYNLPPLKSTAGQSAHSITHSKKRGVYNDLINPSFEQVNQFIYLLLEN